jgi:hypothetical protein
VVRSSAERLRDDGRHAERRLEQQNGAIKLCEI